jgi:hypothetical protein
MNTLTLDATIENGKIRLLTPIWLPDNTRVFVVVPETEIIMEPGKSLHLGSPRLKYPSDASAFVLEEIAESNHVGQ